jgi:hypothetical protein
MSTSGSNALLPSQSLLDLVSPLGLKNPSSHRESLTFSDLI